MDGEPRVIYLVVGILLIIAGLLIAIGAIIT